MPPAIEVRDLGKTFNKRRSIRDLALHPFTKPGKVRALDGVSLEVRQGEIFGLLGPNGAGKTTLLKILSCLVSPTDGSARVSGHDVAAAQHWVKASIGLVTSDERSFYWRLSGRENLRFFAALYNVPPRLVKSRCQALLEKMDLVAKADQPFMEYSTGIKQRLAIARALLHDPPIIFMDEPTRSLDPTAAKNLREFVSTTLNRAEGKTIILATHNLPEAESLCDRLAILHLAKIRRMGTMREIRETAQGDERYVIEVRDFPRGRVPTGAPPSTEGERATNRLEFPGCRVEPSPPGAPDTGGGVRGEGDSTETILARVSSGGEALTELLRRLIAAGATIVSCSRREASLQEVFDLVASEGAGESAAREEASARLREDPAEREWAR